MKILIKNGLVIDPANKIEKKMNILVNDGIIEKTDCGEVEADEIIDAAGKVVAPGLVDIHVHLREPGLEYKEDIMSGTKAAAAGGVTSVACMPNTSPVTDNAAIVSFIKQKAKEAGYANVYPIAAISKGMKGAELSEMGDLRDAGAVAVSDDGKPVEDSGLMRRALEYAQMFNLPVISHCEELSLVNEGSMNEGYTAASMGLKGIPNAAEEVMVSRDILIAQSTNTRVHIAHISTKGSAEIIRHAKSLGVKVTCETCPHYFALTDKAVEGFNTNAKMNPPLRTQEDADAIKAAIADGTVDAIVTDHAPHHNDEKSCEFAVAANGIVGLETSLGLGITELVDKGIISLSKLIELMSVNPARLIGIDRGTLSEGAPADVIVFDPAKEYTVDKSKFNTKGRNTPFDGWTLKGKPEYVVVNGKIVVKEGELL